MSQQPLSVRDFPLLPGESTGGQGQLWEEAQGVTTRKQNRKAKPKLVKSNHVSQAMEGSRPITLPHQGVGWLWLGPQVSLHLGHYPPSPLSSASYSLTAQEWREGFRPMGTV